MVSDARDYYRVGDRVVAVKQYGNNRHIIGVKGTVAVIRAELITVNFDKEGCGHCDGREGPGYSTRNSWNFSYPKSKEVLEFSSSEGMIPLKDSFKE